jgi:GntR family transcriptional regulator
MATELTLIIAKEQRGLLRKNFLEKRLTFSAESCIIALIQDSMELAVQIHISASDGVPIYLQVVNQIKYLVAAGRLTSGEELPPIRTLAEKLVVNPNTIARAYRELEIAGIVEKRRTAGTYVTDQGSPLARRERMKILTDRIDQLLAEAEHMNVSLEEILKLTQQRFTVIRSSRPKDATND